MLPKLAHLPEWVLTRLRWELISVEIAGNGARAAELQMSGSPEPAQQEVVIAATTGALAVAPDQDVASVELVAMRRLLRRVEGVVRSTPAQISAPFQGAPILLPVPGVRAARTRRVSPRMQDPAALTPAMTPCTATAVPHLTGLKAGASTWTPFLKHALTYNDRYARATFCGPPRVARRSTRGYFLQFSAAPTALGM